jgi:hypothetical protein
MLYRPVDIHEGRQNSYARGETSRLETLVPQQTYDE